MTSASSTFHNRLRANFWDMSVDFFETLSGKFPECDETKDALLYTRNIVRGNSDMEESGIQAWYERMMEPVNTKKVKYAKAIERITGEKAAVYHACAHRDAAAIQHSTTSTRFQKLQLKEKIDDKRIGDDDRDIFWKYLQELNRICMEYLGKTPPKVPTKDEIASNIKSRQAPANTADQSSTMLHGFIATLQTLDESYNGGGTYDYANEPAMANTMERWSTVLQKLQTPISDRDDNVIMHMKEDLPEFLWSRTLQSVEWDTLNKLSSFCTVKNAIGDNMMGCIESVAQSLAEDIISGKKDFSSLDLDDIGKQVLSQVNSDEVQSFANNIDSILPAISNLKK
jgi:hypothetical protein